MFASFRKHIVACICVIVLTFALFGWGFYWLFGDLRAIAADITSDRNLIAVNTHSIAILAQLKEILPDITTYQQEMNQLLPTKDELLDFSHWVDGIARVNRVSATIVFQGATGVPTESDPGYVSFVLDVNGPYETVLSFLDAIEVKSNRFIATLDTFDATVLPSDATYHVTAQGRVFFRASNLYATSTTL